MLNINQGSTSHNEQSLVIAGMGRKINAGIACQRNAR